MYRMKPLLALSLLATTLLPLPAGMAGAEQAAISPQNRALNPEPASSKKTDLWRHPQFVPNVGQFDPRARFQLRNAGAAWWIGEHEIWLTVLQGTEGTQGTQGTSALPPCAPVTTQHAARSTQHVRALHAGSPCHLVNIRLTFPGLNPNAHLVGLDPQPAAMNYLTGSDPAHWRTDVPLYRAVRWEEAYPGTSLLLEPSDNGLHIIMEAASTAAPAAHDLQIDGANAVRLQENGQLLADTPLGPVSLPQVLTPSGQSLVTTVSNYTVSFSSSSSSSSLNLPTQNSELRTQDLLYSTFIGGSDQDIGTAVAVSDSGAMYITGSTYSLDYPTTPGAFDTTFDNIDTVVTKLDPSGELAYSTFLGGSTNDQGYTIAVDAGGNAIVAGRTFSMDFPTTPGAYDTTFNGFDFYADLFVTKLNPTGSALVYSTFLGGRDEDYVYDTHLGPGAVVYLTGQTWSRDFPTTPGAYDTTYNSGEGDAFITQLNGEGSGLVFSTFLGGSTDGGDAAYGLALAPGGAVYVVGNTASTDFPTTPGAFDTHLDGPSDAFVTELNASGNALVYSTYLGGSAQDGQTADIALAARPAAGSPAGDGAAFVTGSTASRDFPTTPGAFDTVFTGTTDAFVTRLNPSGSGLDYSTFLAGSGAYGDFGYSIAVVSGGIVYVSGQTSSSDFPTSSNAFDTTFNGGAWDAFITVVNPTGDNLLYSTFLGGSSSDCSAACPITVASDGSVYIAGQTFSADFPTTPNAYHATYQGNGDVFVSRLSPGLPSMQVASITPQYRPAGNRYRVGTTVTIRSATGNPVSGAEVTVQLTAPNGQRFQLTRTTNSRGQIAVSAYTARTGTYTFTVLDVQKARWIYNQAANVETSDSVTIP